MRAGRSLTHEIFFSTGTPDGNVTWDVRDETGTPVQSGTITPQALDVSADIQIGGTANALAAGTVYGWRDLSWAYAVGGVQVRGDYRYVLEAILPFGVRCAGVRSKLGVTVDDLHDEEIPLTKAYLDFEQLVTAELLNAVDLTDGLALMTIGDAIEAVAALALLPTMQVRVATSESSGTNQFKRQTVDWDQVASRLIGQVVAGQVLVAPALASAGEGTLFLLVTPATNIFSGG